MRGAARSRPIDVESHADVATFDPEEWDALAGDDPLATHAFARAVQNAGVEGAVYRHVVLRRAGAAVATASLSLMRVRLDLLSPNPLRRAVAVGRRLRPGLLRVPVLFVGLPVSFGQAGVRMVPGEDTAGMIDALAAAADDAAAELGAGVICFKELTDAEAAELDGLRAHGYFRAESLPGCAIERPFSSFEAYVAAMRSPYRRQARADLAAREAHGLRLVHVENYPAACPEIFRLYERVMDRAPYQLERLNRAFFERLGDAFGSHIRALVVERDGRTLGAAVIFVGPAATSFLLAGLDYDAPAAWRVYPNLVLEVVREAIGAGARRIVLGQTSYALKGRLGGVTSPRHLFLRARRRWANTLFRTASPALFPAMAVPARRVFGAHASGWEPVERTLASR